MFLRVEDDMALSAAYPNSDSGVREDQGLKNLADLRAFEESQAQVGQKHRRELYIARSAEVRLIPQCELMPPWPGMRVAQC